MGHVYCTSVSLTSFVSDIILSILQILTHLILLIALYQVVAINIPRHRELKEFP